MSEVMLDFQRGERIGFDRVRDAERFTVSDAGVVVIGKGQRFS